MTDTHATIADATAWSEFWAQNAGGDGGGCLPERWAAIEEAQKAAWRSFTSDLPERSRLLDLATGDGRVLRWIRAERSDLALIGIDLAATLPPAPEGTETRGGVAMEDLPFDDRSCDAVVSQFGFEYGDVAKVAAEIARVLAQGGRIGLMVHRGDGPILEHNLARRAAIDWALFEKAVAKTVANALTAPNGGTDAAAQVAGAFNMLGARVHGDSSPAWEIPEALRRAVLLGSDTQAILGTIAAIEAQAHNELGRIASLERACATADARDELVGAFARHGLKLVDTAPVTEPSGRSLADFLTFS
ncbi:class I SAM-dependent methyltransferase [Erythrobacter sp. JK5]|uniref:class I SAM-dependent methyltransferase n=1 Tax=Erythrobacter sp. JK5 TaxID=2829500 RepID=UPI001BA830B7|nr:class I SAM-dependent methyltransferase [Erythrobacter sp. JK5]QUL36609.1 class I SAM-dependent methyltransferase [Erythrobacter sp. JK5]